MGLDNGIRINGIKTDEIPSFVNFDLYTYSGKNEIEICYMRKCWGIRNEIKAVCHFSEDEEAPLKLDVEDIPALIRIYKKYTHPDYYEENNIGIWEYDEMIDQIIQCIMALSWLKTYWELHPNIEVEFIDSY